MKTKIIWLIILITFVLFVALSPVCWDADGSGFGIYLSGTTKLVIAVSHIRVYF